LRQGVDSAHGDNTGTLKELVASWVNIECDLTPLIRTDDKHHQSFVSNTYGKLLCPVEWYWRDPVIRAGIYDCITTFIVSENLWPMFMYENYQADTNNLECWLLKLKLLVMVSNQKISTDSHFIASQGFFTSPSFANEVDDNGNSANIIENNHCTWKRSD
ncbi:hypothetical protein EV424DRAFT_1337968, partial [Suillus variegatus]